MASLLYYDPDPVWREAVDRGLLDGVATVLTAATFGDAIALARSEPVDAVAADPPDAEVLPFVSAVGQLRGPAPIVLFMPLARARSAFEGMNGGADRFVEKREPAAETARALANGALRSGRRSSSSSPGLRSTSSGWRTGTTSTPTSPGNSRRSWTARRSGPRAWTRSEAS